MLQSPLPQSPLPPAPLRVRVRVQSKGNGPKQGCAVEQGMVWEVLTLKQAEGFKIGHVWHKQFR